MKDKRILLIEDNLDIQVFVRGVARLEGAQLRGVITGEDGLAVLKQDANFDLVLLDLNLPGMSGWDVLTVLEETPPAWPARPPIVIFTAAFNEATLDQAQTRGAAGVITKPISALDLVARINSFLE